jgi:phage-related baseplate assembly protein
LALGEAFKQLVQVAHLPIFFTLLAVVLVGKAQLVLVATVETVVAQEETRPLTTRVGQLFLTSGAIQVALMVGCR